MTDQLLSYNAFGLVKVTANEVTVTITAVTKSGKAINRVLLQEFDTPLVGFEKSEFVSANFGAFISEGAKSRITFHDLVMQENLPNAGDISEVTSALAKAIKMVKAGLK